jgi:hypothetical protein
MISLFQILSLQDLVDQKLYKESHVRNLVAHMALSKRLQDIQMEYDLEHCVATGKKSESFAEFQLRNSSRVPDWTNKSISATSIYDLSEEYAGMTLVSHLDR